MRTWQAPGEPYDHLPFFYSDLFELGYEAVGEVDSRHATVAEWIEPNRKGVIAIWTTSGGRAGFLLWDVWGKVEEATSAYPRRRAGRRGATAGADRLRCPARLTVYSMSFVRRAISRSRSVIRGGRMGGPANGDTLVADDDVRVVVAASAISARRFTKAIPSR